ncbi:MAG: hypothetical protein ACRDQF_12135 [Thermocrispum sp.]
MTSTEPTAELLPMPTGYGTVEATMSWQAVRAKLAAAKQYWFAANRSGGRSPHLVPLDGLWLADRWYHGGSPETLHRRLVAKNPNVTMHLPHAWDVVIVEGVVQTLQVSPEEAQRLADAFEAKYPEYGKSEAKLWERPHALLPRKVLAWSEFPKDTTRFVF